MMLVLIRENLCLSNTIVITCIDLFWNEWFDVIPGFNTKEYNLSKNNMNKNKYQNTSDPIPGFKGNHAWPKEDKKESTNKNKKASILLFIHSHNCYEYWMVPYCFLHSFNDDDVLLYVYHINIHVMLILHKCYTSIGL